jgi:hypothetical protein
MQLERVFIMLKQYRNDLFGDRGTDIQSALNYANRLLSAAPDSASGFTALHVVLNTVINAVEAQSAAPNHPADVAADVAVPADPRAMFLEEIEGRLNTLREELGDKIFDRLAEDLENLDITVSFNR